MNEQPKKVYTMEENIKYISFSLKDIAKALQELTKLLGQKSANSNDFDGSIL